MRPGCPRLSRLRLGTSACAKAPKQLCSIFWATATVAGCIRLTLPAMLRPMQTAMPGRSRLRRHALLAVRTTVGSASSLWYRSVVPHLDTPAAVQAQPLHNIMCVLCRGPRVKRGPHDVHFIDKPAF